MSEKMDSIKPSPRREKPQTLDGIQATKSLNDSCGSDPAINCGADIRLARTRSRGAETRNIRDHSSDGVMSTTAATTFKTAVEFENSESGTRRESLNYDDTSPSGQSAFTKSILGRSMRLSSVAGGTTTRKCVLTLDGYSYVIVASTPENLPKRDDLSCSGGSSSSGGASSNTNTGCPLQSSGVSGSGPGTTSHNQHQHSTSDRGLTGCNTQITGSAGGGAGGGAGVTTSAGGGNNIHDFSKITSPSGVDSTLENSNNNSSSSNISITNNSAVSTINGQVARHGALTIVRRSNSRKSFSQFESQHLHSQVSTPTPSSTHSGFLGDSLAKATNSSQDNRLNEANIATSLSSAQTPSSAQVPTYSIHHQHHQHHQHSTPNIAQNVKMLPTSPSSGNNALPSTDDMEHPMEDTTSTVASGLTIASPTDLATDNLPAVDTPDACDKAALRLRSLLRMLNAGEIQADVLQKNLHYAARVLEAVFLDESKSRSPTSGKSKLRQNSCSSVECEDSGDINNFEEYCLGQGNKQDIKDERCNGDCKNVECNQHKHTTHTSLDPADNTNENNNINTSCSMLGNRTDEADSEEHAKDTQNQNASDNQTSIDSRTKGVCMAPQTHSGPTGPPEDSADQPKDSSEISATETNKDSHKEDNSNNTCSSKTNTSSSENVNNSSVSSSSCSNKATMQRQKRLRTPVWARTLTTDKTYIKIYFIRNYYKLFLFKIYFKFDELLICFIHFSKTNFNYFKF